ncbi:MAG: RNA repair domain-containing protein [Methanoregula sp.]
MRPALYFSGVRVRLVDRGAPGDCSYVDGTNIRTLDAYCFEIASEQGVKYIPYHRIRKIIYNGKTVWER